MLCQRKDGADVNQRDGRGRAPIHYACLNGDCKFVRILLDAGADPNLHTDTYEPMSAEFTFAAVCIAVERGFEEIVDLLLMEQTYSNVLHTAGRFCIVQ